MSEAPPFFQHHRAVQLSVPARGGACTKGRVVAVHSFSSLPINQSRGELLRSHAGCLAVKHCHED